VFCLFANVARGVHNILDYGAVPDLEDTATAYKNGDAIYAALYAANATSTDREVYVPGNTTFTFMPVQAADLVNVTITVNGTLLASKNNLDYPVYSSGGVVTIFDFTRM
jgi:hypothetical protein